MRYFSGGATLDTLFEMELLVRAGLTPSEALIAGTANSAKVLGELSDRGTIEAGKRADLVVVGPLDDFFDLPGRFLIIRDDDLFRAKPLRRLNPARDRFLHSVGNSSVFRFEIGQHTYILDAYLADPKGAAERYEISQQFQSAQLVMRTRR